MHAFTLVQPDSLDDAAAALSSDPDAMIMAGGQTLIPTLKQRLAQASTIIDLNRIQGLDGITVDDRGITIGAMARHAAVAGDAALAAAIPALAKLAGGIGDPQVRNRGTIGGSLANNDPAADYPAAALGLGATIVTTAREIPADDFFEGIFMTALEEGELIKAVRVPRPRRAAYHKMEQPASGYCLVSVFVADTGSGVRVAVSGAGADGVFRATAFEEALSADFSPDALTGLTVSADDLMSDIHGTAAYRAHLIGVLAKRAVVEAAA